MNNKLQNIIINYFWDNFGIPIVTRCSRTSVDTERHTSIPQIQNNYILDKLSVYRIELYLYDCLSRRAAINYRNGSKYRFFSITLKHNKMKSKEQAHLYLSSEDKEKALGEIAVDYCKEIVRLKEARNIKTDQALISVFDELDKKFRSFANIVNTKLPYTKPVKAHGFEMILESFSPKAFDYWIEGHNKNIKN